MLCNSISHFGKFVLEQAHLNRRAVREIMLIVHTVCFLQSQSDLLVLHNVARILELSVPLMDHPSEGFLAQLEEDMMKLILKHGMMVSKELYGVIVGSVSD